MVGKQILQAIEGDAIAQKSLKGFTPLQLCDKIRTERRRIARLSTKKKQEKRS